MRQRATGSVQFPDAQAIAGPNVVERLLKSGAIIPRPAGLIVKQMPHINASGEQSVALEVRGLPMGSLATRMCPTSMFGKLPFACFRLSAQSDMFLELILPGCSRGVKAPRRFCRNFHVRRFGVCSLPVTYDAKRGRATMAVSFKGAHFPHEIILMGVRWYVAYPMVLPLSRCG